jgi:hypothetical protein
MPSDKRKVNSKFFGTFSRIVYHLTLKVLYYMWKNGTVVFRIKLFNISLHYLFSFISDGQVNTDKSGTSNQASALRDGVWTNTSGEYYNAGQAATNGH